MTQADGLPIAYARASRDKAQVHAERGGKRTLVAIMQQTLMVMLGKRDDAAVA